MKRTVSKMLIVLILGISLLLATNNQVSVYAQDVNNFAIDINEWMPDTNLQTLLAKQLGINVNEITPEKMAGLQTIVIDSNSMITDITGLEYAINLESLYIITNLISDFSAVEKMSNLGYLIINSMILNDDNFPVLPKSLKNLDIAKSTVTNAVLDEVAELPDLVSFNADSNMRITTIAPLANLPKLERLSIQFCGVTDFTIINQFPKLNNLAAFGQNTGRYDETTTVTSNDVVYSSESQTLFIPFTLMPNRMTNFDGYIPPFTMSNSQSDMYFDINGVQLEADRISVSELGITISNIDIGEFEDMNTFMYNARLDNVLGTYNIPEGFGFYAISAGTYLHSFKLIHVTVGADVTVNYVDEKGTTLADAVVLSGNIGDSYTAAALPITGYTLSDIVGSETGIFSDVEQTVTYVYEKENKSNVGSGNNGNSNESSNNSGTNAGEDNIESKVGGRGFLPNSGIQSSYDGIMLLVTGFVIILISVLKKKISK